MNVSLQKNNSKPRVVIIDYLKAMLILLVVFGHLLRGVDTDFAQKLYKFIYIFHIPLFVFISGFLSKLKLKNILQLILIYIFFQLIYTYVSIVILEETDLNNPITTPNWLMWYIVSLICWRLTTPLLQKLSNNTAWKLLFFIFVFILGSFVGYINSITRAFGLSRTIVFYPYFVAGYFQSHNKSNNNLTSLSESKTNKFYLSIKLILFVASITLSIFLISNNVFSRSDLYRAQPFNSAYDARNRVILYFLTFIIIPMLTSIRLKKRSKFIEFISKNTLSVYLLHGFIIFIFWHFKILSSSNLSILALLPIAILITILLALVGYLNKILKSKL